MNDELAAARMSTEQAAAVLGDPDTLFVDTRQEWEFERGHIPGAIRIQAYVEDNRLEDLPRDRTLVFYCACSAEQSSARAAVILSAMGHEKVFALKGGWHAWLAEQRPVARSPR
jgi:rhodanese-related sulfurtransferase